MDHVDCTLSSYIEDFLDFLDASREQLSMSISTLEEANLEQQDIEHFIEFANAGATQRAQAVSRLKAVRKKRREAKENIELCTPIVDWIDKNQITINSLKNLLGSTRRTERAQVNRAYTIRTHILDGICEGAIIRK